MPEQLYRVCVANRGLRGCGSDFGPCPAGHEGGHCFIPVPPQPEPYSSKDARKYFEAQIETVPWLKALGLKANYKSDTRCLVVDFNNDHESPAVVVYHDSVRVSQKTDYGSHSAVYYSAPYAWSAFIKEVDKVYPQMCLDFCNKKMPGEEWKLGGANLGECGWALSEMLWDGKHRYPAFDTENNTLYGEAYTKNNKTIADFYEEYRP